MTKRVLAIGVLTAAVAGLGSTAAFANPAGYTAGQDFSVYLSCQK